MPTTMTATQVGRLRDAGVPPACEETINKIVAGLDQHGINLDWDKFVEYVRDNSTMRVSLAWDFINCFCPKP